MKGDKHESLNRSQHLNRTNFCNTNSFSNIRMFHKFTNHSIMEFMFIHHFFYINPNTQKPLKCFEFDERK